MKISKHRSALILHATNFKWTPESRRLAKKLDVVLVQPFPRGAARKPTPPAVSGD
jgi:hypothetical protein